MTILVAVANDPVRDAVLDVAINLAQGLGEELDIVHLVDDENADATDKEIRDAIRDRVEGENVVATVSLEQITHGASRPNHRIGQELVDLAADVDVTHVVMGHSEKGLFEQLSQGSTAYAVVSAVDVPVTIVPYSAATPVDDEAATDRR